MQKVIYTAAFLFSVLLFSFSVHAYPNSGASTINNRVGTCNGLIPNTDCISCHGAGSTGTTFTNEFTSSTTIVSPSSVNDFTLAITAGPSITTTPISNRGRGGFNLKVIDVANPSSLVGTLATNGDSNAVLDSSILRHSTSAANNWSLRWTAPPSAVSATMCYCVNSVNGDGGASTDDNFSCGFRNITVNTPPTAVNDVFSVDENASGISVSPLTEGISDSDPDGDTPLTISAFGTDNVTGATLSCSTVTNNCSITITGNYDSLATGQSQTLTGSMTYELDDNIQQTTTGTMTVRVTGTNDTPVIAGLTAYAIPQDSSNQAIGLTASDAESQNLTWTLTTPPSTGTITSPTFPFVGTAPNITYTPNAGYQPQDTFTVSVIDDDSSPESTSSVVTISIANDPPIIGQGDTPLTFATPEETPLNIMLSASDPDADPIVWSSTTPNNGSVSLSGTDANQQVTYTPDVDFYDDVTADTFTVSVLAGGRTDSIVINVNVSDVNDAPVFNQTISTQNILEETLFTIDVATVASVDDVDLTDINNGGGTLTWSISSGNFGDMAISNVGVLTWTPVQRISQTNHTVQASVTDGEFTANTSFNIIVSPIDTDSDTVPNYDDFCPAIADSTNGDNDGDGTASIDVSPTDNIGGDVCDADDDNDGMPDTFEIQYGFDPFNAADAAEDFDGDGFSNLEEFTNATEPKEGSLNDITINSTGYLTSYNLVAPVPSDINPLATSIVADNYGPYRPGINEIIWTLSNETDATLLITKQNLNVTPIVSFESDQIGVEGGNNTVTASLNGDAVIYPVTINYVVSGSADIVDHNAADGAMTISQGNTATSLTVAITSDMLTEPDETVTLTISDVSNAVLGVNNSHSIIIKDGNVAPTSSMNITQLGIGEVGLIYSADGNVSINLNISDANLAQTHSIDWSATDNALSPPTDASTTSWSFAPTAGTYSIVVSVTDNGSPALSNTLSKIIVVTSDPAPVLGGGDSDNDGTIDSLEGYDDSDADGIADYLDALDDSHLISDQTANIANSFVIATEPGLTIITGSTSVASSTAGTALTDDEVAQFAGAGGIAVINSDDSYEHIGGLYDFEINGLISAASVRIVIPLQVAIPKNALYRKYSTTSGWSNFVSDGVKNQVYSAKGSSGVCPEVGSSDYVQGLTYLDSCLQLLIEDGGVNDQDGQANSRVLDPGAISITVSDPVEESVGEGGAFPMTMLYIMTLLLLLRFKKEN